MAGPLVSIVTPSYNRHALLKHQYASILKQSEQDFEWLILDDSPEPSPYFTQIDDRRVRYHHHRGAKMLVSAKRNWLVERARASIIAHFDDDDYYAPCYLATMLARLQSQACDITKLSAWFVYSAQLKRLGYWNTVDMLGLHFTFGPEPALHAFFNHTVPENMRNNYLGYGFSYVYRKSLWQRTPFPAVEYASDYGFVAAAMAKGCQIDHFADSEGLCVHILRRDNMSKSFPQYLLPEFMLEKFFNGDVRDFLDS